MDQILATKSLQAERKTIHVEFRENDRGQFLRIMEESHGRRNTVIVPASGLDEFLDVLEEVLKSVDEANSTSGDKPPAAVDSNP